MNLPRTSAAARPASITPHPVRRQVVTFICTACEVIINEREPKLPPGWALETIGDDQFAYCPDCAIDLPKGENQ